jgi:hypothetical protein
MLDKTLIFKEFVNFTSTGIEGFFVCFTGEKINFKIWFEDGCWQMKQAGTRSKETLRAIKARLFHWFNILTKGAQNEN